MDFFDNLNSLDNFAPKKFIFVNFYDKEACIVWNDETLVVLDYPLPETLTDGKILKAPGKIKDIQMLKNKIYVLCSPTGIYKLSQDYSFGKISISGIGIGITFYQVFAPKNNVLYCENKHAKTVKPIFNILGNMQNITFFHLYVDELHEDLQAVLLQDKKCDSCLINNKNDLLLFCNDETKIIHYSTAIILDIIAFHKNGLIYGIILRTDVNKIVFIYPRLNKLQIDEIKLDTEPKALCAGVYSSNENNVWILYSDGEFTYHLRKNLNNRNSVDTISNSEKNFLYFTLYKTQKVSGLIRNESDSIVLLQVPIEGLEISEIEEVDEEETTQLSPEMVKGSDALIDEITEKYIELAEINEKLIEQKDLLEKINMFTKKHRVECIPKVKVYCLPDRKLIVANFQKNLPQGSQVVVSVKQNCRDIFIIKRITDTETVVELGLSNDLINHLAVMYVHLIAINMKNGPWCLINDFIKDPIMKHDTKHPLETDKLNFLNKKKSMLKKLIIDKKVDMKTLSEIKRSIRRELPEV